VTRAPRRIRVTVTCALLVALAGGPASAQTDVKQPKRPPRGQPTPAEQGRATESPGAMLDRANHFLMLGRCGDAIPILERLVKDYPRIAAANEMLAGCYIKEGRPADAAAFLERRLAEDPEQFAYARELGRAYMDLGRREEAVAVWRRLLAADEKTASMYGHVAKMMQEAGLYDEAIEILREGTKYQETAEYYSREVVRLERIVGREEDAFRDALQLVGRRPGALEGEIRDVSDIYRESKKRERLVAILDSTAAASGDRTGAFRTLRTIFLIEAERYDEARAHLLGAGAPAFREQELYALLVHLGKMPPAGARFAALRGDLMRLFLERFGASAFAPHVRLMAAENAREAARGAPEQERAKLLAEAIAQCDAAKRGGMGAPYFDGAVILKARVLYEDQRRPAEALAELANAKRRDGPRRLEIEELRVRILLASENQGAAAADLGRVAADADSSVALLGRYGLGRLAFLAGRYDESVKTLSEVAEKHAGSRWANDALELAIELQQALPEGRGALDLYRAAALTRSRGAPAAALDSLAALERRYPASSLAPRAIFVKGEIEAETGAVAAAAADFAKLVESYPLHELAPRALERLAGLAEGERPAEALSTYGALMERYPDYPFMERVRGRYVTLGKATGPAGSPGAAAPAAPPAPKKGSK
jgi:tetratricopeptide (TPR) repeat protein